MGWVRANLDLFVPISASWDTQHRRRRNRHLRWLQLPGPQRTGGDVQRAGHAVLASVAAASAKSAKPSSKVNTTGFDGGAVRPCSAPRSSETVIGVRPLSTMRSTWWAKTCGVTAYGAIHPAGSAETEW
jgi:hypothetical protein